MKYIHYIIVTVAMLLVGTAQVGAQTDRNLIRWKPTASAVQPAITTWA